MSWWWIPARCLWLPWHEWIGTARASLAIWHVKKATGPFTAWDWEQISGANINDSPRNSFQQFSFRLPHTSLLKVYCGIIFHKADHACWAGTAEVSAEVFLVSAIRKYLVLWFHTPARSWFFFFFFHRSLFVAQDGFVGPELKSV